MVSFVFSSNVYTLYLCLLPATLFSTHRSSCITVQRCIAATRSGAWRPWPVFAWRLWELDVLSCLCVLLEAFKDILLPPPLGFWKSRDTLNNTQPIMCWSGWHFGQWGKGDSSHLGTANDLVILFHHPLVNLSELSTIRKSNLWNSPVVSWMHPVKKGKNPTTTNFRFYLWNCCNAFLCLRLTLLAF